MKRIAIYLMCLLLAATLTVSALAAGDVSGALTPSETTVYRGESITVTVNISEFAACKAGSLRLTYDTSVFACSDNVWLLSNTTASDPTGDAVFAFSGATDVSGDIYRFTLTAKADAVLGDAQITAKLTLRDASGSSTTLTLSATVTVACDHSYGDWTKVDDSTHSHVCGICKNTETASHTWDGGTVTTATACDQPGVMTYTCTACGATKTEPIPATDHVWDSGTVTKAATCAATGEKLYTCAVCGATKTETVPMTSEHSYGSWSEADGEKHSHTCTICGKSESASHSWDGGKITKAATCAAEGEKTYTCADCGATKTESVSKTEEHVYDHACDTDCNVCGAVRTVTHSYRETWSSDASGHWHVCAVCGNRAEETAHTPGEAATETQAQTCTVCGYVIQAALGHTHRYDSTYSYDEEGHWYACAGCDERKGYTLHYFTNNCDTTCDICGYQRETEHDFSQHWTYDSTGHWHACTVCGEILELEPHTPGESATETSDQICTVCGYVIQAAQNHVHAPNGDLLADEEGHWYQCACGIQFEQEAHSWDGGVYDSTASTMTYCCTVCGFTRVEWVQPEDPGGDATAPSDPQESAAPTQSSGDAAGGDRDGQTYGGTDPGAQGLEWYWYAIIAVCVLLLGAVIFVIIGILVSRKQVGRFSAK